MQNDQLDKAIEPFLRAEAILAPLALRDDKPLREVLPGVWPTMGDLRNLVKALMVTNGKEGK